MGNVEIRSLANANAAVDDSALKSAHTQFLTYGRGFFPIDRSAFNLLFEERVPFWLIDQVYDAYYRHGEKAGKAVEYRDIAVALIAGCKLSVPEKLRMVFELVEKPERNYETTPEELAERLADMIVSAVVPLRGEEVEPGKILYPAKRCHACREIPVNLVYRCDVCPVTASVCGVDLGVMLCHKCSGTWEGQAPTKTIPAHMLSSLNKRGDLEAHADGNEAPGFSPIKQSFHTKTHRLIRQHMAPNPKQPYFMNVACLACDTTPITGYRIHCLECTDFCALCPRCYTDGEQPSAHVPTHPMQKIEQTQTVLDEVIRFLEQLGLTSPNLYQRQQARLERLLAAAEANNDEASATDAKLRLIAMSHGGPKPINAALIAKKTVSPAAFVQPLTPQQAESAEGLISWGTQCERVMALLGGHCVHYVPRVPDTEGFETVDPDHLTVQR